MKHFVKLQSLISLADVFMLASKKSILYPTAFSLALALGFVTIPRQPTLAESQLAPLNNGLRRPSEASLSFESQAVKISTSMNTAGTGVRLFDPPDDGGAVPTTAGGGTRGGSCTPNGTSIIPLMPRKNSVLTVSAYPTFYLYIPESTSQTGKFVLQEQDQDDEVYEVAFSIPKTPGIVSVALPNAALPPLKVGKVYHWFLVVMCDPEDNSRNAITDGWIKRIEPSATLTNELQKTSLRDRPWVYGKAGIWQEALATLAQLHRSSPTDPQISADWEKLLTEVGLSKISRDPLVDCCIVQN